MGNITTRNRLHDLEYSCYTVNNNDFRRDENNDDTNDRFLSQAITQDLYIMQPRDRGNG